MAFIRMLLVISTLAAVMPALATAHEGKTAQRAGSPSLETSVHVGHRGTTPRLGLPVDVDVSVQARRVDYRPRVGDP